MTTTNPANYVTANRFYVEIENSIKASFSECSGIGVTIKTQPVTEGGVNDQQRFMLDNPEFSNVTLKRGITDSLDFWTWLQSILASKPNQRKNVAILLFNQAGETMQCWTLIGAVPVGLKADSLQASSESVALEELTLAYEGLKIEKTGSAADHTSGRHKETGYFMGEA